MEDRAQKLLILVGEEGVDLESRDYNKLKEVIINYLNEKNQNFNAFLIKLLTNVVAQVSLKQHIYAALTAHISYKHQNISTNIIQSTLTQLQTTLSDGKLYQTINIITYLAELMNISMLNSSTFMNVLDDLLKAIENEAPMHPHRKIIIAALTRTIPIYAYSLHQKVPNELKKYMDKINKISSKTDPIHKISDRGILADYSLVHTLSTFDNLNQYHNNSKHIIKLNPSLTAHLPEYYPLATRNEDYALFTTTTQAYIHRNNIQNLIATFSTNSQLLILKIVNYIKYHNKQYTIQYIIETIISKSLCNIKGSLADTYLLVSLCKQESIGKQAQKYMYEQLLELFKSGQTLNLDILMQFTKILSYVSNNEGLNTLWEWEHFLEVDQNYAQREVIIKITAERLQLLNDKISIPILAKYLPEKRKNEEQYQSVQDMEIFEDFTNKLATKQQSSLIIPFIKEQHSYEIFLEALFRRTSLSQTHLQILLTRYNGIFELYREDYDWILINKIRNFWSFSFFNRMLYLKEMISKGYLAYESYVKYIGKMECEGVEKIEVKVQLNELNKVYGKMINK